MYDVERWIEEELDKEDYPFRNEEEFQRNVENLARGSERQKQAYKHFLRGGSVYTDDEYLRRFGKKKFEKHSGWSGWFNSGRGEYDDSLKRVDAFNKVYADEKKKEIKDIRGAYALKRVKSISIDKEYKSDTVDEIKESQQERVTELGDIQQRYKEARDKAKSATTYAETREFLDGFDTGEWFEVYAKSTTENDFSEVQDRIINMDLK